MNIPGERCKKLLDLAGKDAAHEKRYVSLARKIAMRHRLKLGRRKFCKKCNSLLDGKNLVVRLKSKTIIYACRNCNTAQRIPIRKKL